jgi:DNA polymerase III epsilon subunit-like protein
MTKLLVIDTETGGLDASLHSLLELGAVVWKNGTIIAETEIGILENPFVVTATGMAVNRIDLVTHAKTAMDLLEGPHAAGLHSTLLLFYTVEYTLSISCKGIFLIIYFLISFHLFY